MRFFFEASCPPLVLRGEKQIACDFLNVPIPTTLRLSFRPLPILHVNEMPSKCVHREYKCASQKEGEGAPKNDRNGRHRKNIALDLYNVIRKSREFMLSSMFPSVLLLDPLILPLPDPPSTSNSQNTRTQKKYLALLHNPSRALMHI